MSNKKGLAWVEVIYIMYGRFSLGSSRNMELWLSNAFGQFDHNYIEFWLVSIAKINLCHRVLILLFFPFCSVLTSIFCFCVICREWVRQYWRASSWKCQQICRCASWLHRASKERTPYLWCLLWMWWVNCYI